jgi:hypothetical protein
LCGSKFPFLSFSDVKPVSEETAQVLAVQKTSLKKNTATLATKIDCHFFAIEIAKMLFFPIPDVQRNNY